MKDYISIGLPPVVVPLWECKSNCVNDFKSGKE